MNIIDSHAHLFSSDFDTDRDQVIANATAAGVTKIINIGAGYGIESAKKSIELCQQYPQIYTAVGIHPHDSGKDYDLVELRQLAKHPQVVAIGETGMDFHYNFSPPAAQEKALREQINLAKELNKPIVIHCRLAADQIFQVLKEENAAEVGGVFHCYCETAEFAVKLRDLNFLVAFGGMITFKKSENIRAAAKDIPLDQIIVETDCPFLAPDPFRGKRAEPAHTAIVLNKIAEIKGLPLDEVASIILKNTQKLFKIA